MKNVAASVRQRLLNLARASDRNFQELVQYFAMCRFLRRLVESSAGDRFILKGALLLHALDIADARSTVDIDLLGRIPNDPETIRRVVVEATRQEVEPDGLRFDPDTISVSEITPGADYVGRRVRFTGQLGVISIPMQLDIGFSDIPFPAPTLIECPTLLGFAPAKLRAYAPETSIAEKAQTILYLEVLNSRMKDFYDIWLMARTLQIDEELLETALVTTFGARGTPIATDTVLFTETFYDDPTKQRQWSAFVRKRKIEAAPETFSEISRWVMGYLKPRLEGAALATAASRPRTVPRSYYD